jgi:A/G-specific adenine glycosylase
MPETVAELTKLPGIGRYTAGAISSIAFGQDAPVVDANVIRVLCRVFALRGDPKSSTSLVKRIWELAEESLPKGHAREYNQALMELGALICQPTAPRCLQCPIANHCDGLKTGDPGAFPEFGEAKKWIDAIHAACFVENNDKLLIVQRPLEQLWGGLWELPRVAVTPDEDPVKAAIRAVHETVGITVTQPRPAGVVKHVVTNRRVTLLGFAADWDGQGEPTPLACRQFAWADESELETYAISSPQTALLSQWRENA